MRTIGDNIGALVNSGATFNSPATLVPDNSTIYNITHNGTDRDSFIGRSFISFSFGGKNIEDFNLIVTNDGFISKPLTGSFNDLTTNYEVVDGQYYWGTYFVNNELSLTLSTDGATQENIDDFINWFSPGITRELILSEHPNRAIMARIAEPISMSVIPFPLKTDVVENGDTYETITTLYKGSFSIRFVMDSPFWYSKTNLLAKVSASNSSILNDYWIDANNREITVIHSNKDALRIVKEDRIPTADMIPPRDTILFGDEILADIDADVGIIDTSMLQETGEEIGPLIGPIFSAITSLSMTSGIPIYLYYAGTAPSNPMIKFSFTLGNLNSGIYYFVTTPANSVTKKLGTTAASFNTFTIEGIDKQIIKVTAPNAFISYNCAQKAIQAANSYKNLRERTMEDVTHYHAKRWLLALIDYMENLSVSYSNAKSRLRTCMSYFLANTTHNFIIDANNRKAYAILSYKKVVSTDYPTSDIGWLSFGVSNTDIEDVSDMVISDYPKLTERNHFNERGKLDVWSTDDKSLSHKFYHNFPITLNNVAVIFNNKYY